MPTQLSAWAETQLMPSLFQGIACPAAPSGHLLKLFSTAVGEDGSGTEVTGGGYAPFAVTFDPPVVSGGGYACLNPTRIESADATTVWDLDSHFGVIDGSGNLCAYGPVTKLMDPPVAVQAGDRWKAEPGELSIQLAGALSDALKQSVLNWLLRGQTFTPLTGSLLALYDEAGVELAGNGYARLAITLGSLTDTGTGSHAYANTADIWASFTGSVTVGQIGLLAADGTVIMKGALASPKTYGPGIDFLAPAGSQTFTIG